MTREMDATGPGTGLIAALHATAPVGEHAGKLILFGRFVGSWHDGEDNPGAQRPMPTVRLTHHGAVSWSRSPFQSHSRYLQTMRPPVTRYMSTQS